MTMSKTYQPPAQTVFAWLRANCGKGCLAPLTGTDGRGLRAAVQIAELYSYHRQPEVLEAFGLVVRSSMQEECWYLAYHAIAHVMDWSDRAEVWAGAGLPEIVHGRCAFEPKEA